MKDTQLSNEEKSFLKEMMKSEGWQVYSALIDDIVKILRRQATEQKVELEDRLWFSALAQGHEDALNLAVIKTI